MSRSWVQLPWEAQEARPQSAIGSRQSKTVKTPNALRLETEDWRLATGHKEIQAGIAQLVVRQLADPKLRETFNNRRE